MAKEFQNIFFKIINKRIFQHFLFWISYVVFFGLVYGKYENNYLWYFLESVCMLPFIMFATYMSIYVYLPYYLKYRKGILIVLLLIITLFIATLGERIFLRFLNSLPIIINDLFSVVFVYLFLETNFMVGSAIAIKLLKKWMEQQKENHEIEKQNLKSELNMLKAQLHPHFLFNAMNNLYALSIDKSSKTSEGIAKISDLLRSVLYECNDSEFELSKEIKLIENYIELEQLRYSKQIDVTFEKKGEIEGYKIAPMLLFTFVENCFKHVGKADSDNSWVKINLTTVENIISFKSYNSMPAERLQSATKGVGLLNVKKRLGIIYGNKQTLSITEDQKKYKVKLEINCNADE